MVSIADAALELVGTPFRLRGRDPVTGIDCMGLIEFALTKAGLPVRMPRTYTLRQTDAGTLFVGFAKQSGFRPRSGPRRRNDILFFALDGLQHHLAIALGPDDIVHAHAGLGRTIIGKPDPDWRLLHIWSAP